MPKSVGFPVNFSKNQNFRRICEISNFETRREYAVPMGNALPVVNL